jgi:hypothetical protein
MMSLCRRTDGAEEKDAANDGKAGSKRSADGEAGDDGASAKRVKTEEAAIEVCMLAHPAPAYACVAYTSAAVVTGKVACTSSHSSCCSFCT